MLRRSPLPPNFQLTSSEEEQNHPALAQSGDVTGKSGDVLVQPEMERGCSPSVSIPPFGRGFLRHAGKAVVA